MYYEFSGSRPETHIFSRSGPDFLHILWSDSSHYRTLWIEFVTYLVSYSGRHGVAVERQHSGQCKFILFIEWLAAAAAAAASPVVAVFERRQRRDPP